MSYLYFKKDNENKSPAEILHEAHEKIYYDYMNRQEKEKLRSWIKKEIKKQLPKELEGVLNKIFK